MIPSAELVLLDTSAAVHLIRGNAVGAKVAETHALLSRRDRPLISIVSVGELQSLALKLGWGAPRRAKLAKLVSQLVIVNIDQGDIIARYAEIDHFSERVVKPARPMGKNDIWIASTASVVDAHLLTSDADFDHLAPKYLKLERFCAKSGAPIKR